MLRLRQRRKPSRIPTQRSRLKIFTAVPHILIREPSRSLSNRPKSNAKREQIERQRIIKVPRILFATNQLNGTTTRRVRNWQRPSQRQPESKWHKRRTLVSDSTGQHKSKLTISFFNRVATGRRRATKALVEGGCPTNSGHDAETSKWEQKQQEWKTVARNCPAGS